MSAMVASFDSMLRQHGFGPLRKQTISTLQINVGKVCNQACHHCHVDAGPKRTESMSWTTATRIMALLAQSGPAITTVDITGGAPEINPHFEYLVTVSRRLGRHVIDRCNLTILLEDGFAGLGDFLAQNQVEIIASLPCYTRENVDRQRGRGVFEKSIRALLKLNDLGYGVNPSLPLHLVYNPLGPSLPPPEEALESDYKRRLHDDFGIVFNRLFTLANMPINRFAGELTRIGKQEVYEQLLIDRFNPQTVGRLMCRSLISISWDGKLYDCDFNQMLDLPASERRSIWNIESFDAASEKLIATGLHCFACTAGAGSSCGGKLT